MPVLDIEDILGAGPGLVLNSNQRDIAASYLNGTKVFAITKEGFLESTSGWKNRYATIPIGDVAADSDAKKHPLLRLKHDATIIAVSIGCDTAVAADTTDYNVVGIYQSSSSSALSTLSSATTGYSAHVPRDFASLDSTLSKLAAGQTLYLGFAKGGDGVAMSGVVVSVTYTLDRPMLVTGDAEDNVFRIIGGGGGTDGVIASDFLTRPHLAIQDRGVESLRIDVDGKMHGTAPDQYYYHVVNVGDIVEADGGAKKSALFKPHCSVEIVECFMGIEDDADADDDTNYLNVIVKDNSGNILTEGYVNGPYGAGQDMVAGRLYEMGEVNQQYDELASTEWLQVEYLTPGTADTVYGLTLVVVYKKLS